MATSWTHIGLNVASVGHIVGNRYAVLFSG